MRLHANSMKAAIVTVTGFGLKSFQMTLALTSPLQMPMKYFIFDGSTIKDLQSTRGHQCLRLYAEDPDIRSDEIQNLIEKQLEQLNEQLTLIEALEARNASQLDSFVDEEDQWNSLEPEERELLDSKQQIEERIDILAEQLVQMWMGQKSMEG